VETIPCKSKKDEGVEAKVNPRGGIACHTK
jgi:hypothetical protein